MGWEVDPDPGVERNLANLAAELVDAVQGAGRDGQGETPAAVPLDEFDFESTLAQLAEQFAATEDASPEEVAWFVRVMRGIGEGVSAKVRPLLAARIAAERDQGEARDYQQAVDNLRDTQRFTAWWRDRPDLDVQPAGVIAAAYLEAVDGARVDARGR